MILLMRYSTDLPITVNTSLITRQSSRLCRRTVGIYVWTMVPRGGSRRGISFDRPLLTWLVGLLVQYVLAFTFDRGPRRISHDLTDGARNTVLSRL